MSGATIQLDATEAHLATMAIETEIEFLARPRPGANIDGLTALLERQRALHAKLMTIVPKLPVDQAG
jgi:hypothetical protein